MYSNTIKKGGKLCMHLEAMIFQDAVCQKLFLKHIWYVTNWTYERNVF